jgi:hypothetical protein
MAEETNLSGHSQDGKRLHPPFAKLKGMQLTSWKDLAMPEILWAVVVRGNIKREAALDFFRYVTGFVERNPEYADLRLTEIAKLTSEQRTRLIQHMSTWSDEVRGLLQSLLIFPNLPGHTEWLAVLGETTDFNKAASDFATGVKEVLWHRSEPASDCRWVAFLCFIQSGKMKFSSAISDIKETLRAIYEYPNYGDVTHAQSFVRASDMRLGMEDVDLTWVNHFWDECYRKTSCIPEFTEYTFPYTPEEWDKRHAHYAKETARVRKSLISHWFDTSKTTAIDTRHETAFGIALHSQALLDEISIMRLNFSIGGRLALRAIVEAYITLAYLVKKDDPSIWNAYREYGVGQAKLIHLKLKELGKHPMSIDPQLIEAIANEDRWQEFVSINIGHWDDSNLRKNAEDAGLKDVYDQYYNWSSGYIHGSWAALRETVYQKCYNPLHRLHRIPNFGLPILSDVMEDAIDISNKTLDLLATAYPTYADRLKGF